MAYGTNKNYLVANESAGEYEFCETLNDVIQQVKSYIENNSDGTASDVEVFKLTPVEFSVDIVATVLFDKEPQ